MVRIHLPPAASHPNPSIAAVLFRLLDGFSGEAANLCRPKRTGPRIPALSRAFYLHRRGIAAALAEFDAALQTLNQSVPAIKRRIVVACTACILANQQVTVREVELLRAICDTLECPLPPLVVGEAEGPWGPEVTERALL